MVIKTEPNSEIHYWGAGKDEINSYSLGKKDSTDAQGYMIYQVELSEPKILAINALKNSMAFYLSPGSRDTVTITKDTVMLVGNNEAYNRCLQAVDTYQKYCDQILYTRHELKSVQTPEELKEKYGIHYAQAADVIQKSGLPAAFVEEQMTHLDYISRLIVAYITIYSVRDKTEEWKAEFKKVIEMPWSGDAMRSYRGIGKIAQQLPPMKFLMLENGNPNDIKDPYRFMFDECKELFEGKALERVWATFIFQDILNKNYTEVFIELFEEFKQQYPNSPYLSTLQPGMEETMRFHQAEFDENLYHLLPCDSTMTSISEALKPLRGKVTYVDVWATWCGPCKEIFSHVPAFKELAKELDVAYMYLSIDRPQEEKTWRKFIPYYQLKGYHMLASKELTQAVYRELGNERGMITIPRFLIIDKEGKIVVPNAAAPSQPEKLIKQLQKVIAE
ncbi:MAG: TlpA family protein disulfide reductase [Bacteroides sp.]|nr:TlpA family protein disulfide reductase [Bacteroides sp.]